MKRKNVEKDKKATKKKLKKEWVNNMVGGKKHSKNCQNLKKITWVMLNLFPK